LRVGSEATRLASVTIRWPEATSSFSTGRTASACSRIRGMYRITSSMPARAWATFAPSWSSAV
jgi:hypothetical protein